MFQELVDDYDLIVSQRYINAFDCLLAGRIRRVDDNLEVFSDLDSFVKQEFERFWMHAFRELSDEEHRRVGEYIRELCPCRDFWKISVIGRLHDPKLVVRYADYERTVLDKFSFDRGRYAEALWDVFERAYSNVQHAMNTGYDSD